jgi:hypothetical protein
MKTSINNQRENDQQPIIEEIAIKWHIDDVLNIRPDLTNHQAGKVLKHLKDNHDASVGIYWDMIDIVADILYPFTPIDYIQQQLS